MKDKVLIAFLLAGFVFSALFTIVNQINNNSPDDHSTEDEIVDLGHLNNHVHPAPVIVIDSVLDNTTSIEILGSVSHLHLEDINIIVNVSLDGYLSQSYSTHSNGTFSIQVEVGNENFISMTVVAYYPPENSGSDEQFIEIDRTVATPDSDEDGIEDEVDNCVDVPNPLQTDTDDDGLGDACDEFDDNETNNTQNSTSNHSQNNTGEDGNQTNNNTNNTGGDGNTTGSTQPTYDSSDLGQFWLDVFRCQTSETITPVDDLTTSAIETLECSVSLTMNETHITITANGIPDHDFESTLACSQANDCTATQNYEWVIPRYPTNDTTGGHDATNCPEAEGVYECAPALGEVAIALNGVPFYGPEDGPGGDAVASHHGMYVEDRQDIELGVCHAHSGMGGTYHYHADANCLHWHPEEGGTMYDYDMSTPDIVAQNTNNSSHSAVIGVAFDGYPVYGFWGFDDSMNIVEMKSSYKLKDGQTGYNGIDDYEYVQGLGHLDVCNGHFGPTPEFPDGIYHYHSTMVNGAGEMGFPYFLLCYHGVAEIQGDEGVDCSGFGETWGPGIGPPPPGCEGGGGGPPPGGQLLEVTQVSGYSLTLSPEVALLAFLLISYLLSRRRK